MLDVRPAGSGKGLIDQILGDGKKGSIKKAWDIEEENSDAEASGDGPGPSAVSLHICVLNQRQEIIHHNR